MFWNRQGPPILLELIGLIRLLTGVRGIRSRLWFWGGLLGVLGERGLSSGELVHYILDGLPLGIVPRLIRSRRRTYLWDWLFLDLRLSGGRAGGAREGIERGGEFEQPFTSRRFHALLLSLGTRLRRRFGGLLCGLIYLR